MNWAKRLLLFGVLLTTGCVKQDTEILSRVGRTLAEKSKTSTTGLRERLPFRITTGMNEPTLTERVQQRLANDKQLAAVKFEIQANGAEVELKGAVEREEQKRRAVDLAETTQGVEKVVDSIQLPDVPRPE